MRKYSWNEYSWNVKQEIIQRTRLKHPYVKSWNSMPCRVCRDETQYVCIKHNFNDTLSLYKDHFDYMRVCRNCMKKSLWQVHTKSVILQLMKQKFTTVPKDIWELLSNKYLDW